MMRREESPTAASTILCCVLVFLFFIEVQARNPKGVCSSSSCGDIQNISHPFRLKGDQAGCGDPDYELSCENNKTILEIFPGKYYVKNISYYDQRIRVVDVSFANGSCNLPYGSPQSVDEAVSDFRFRGFVNDNYNSSSHIRIIKCSRNISKAAYYNYTAIPCLTRNGTHVYAYYYGQSVYFKLQPSCWTISLVPVDFEEIESPSYGAIMKMLQGGFDLGWSLECRDCSLSGKSCEVSSWDKPLTYVCSREYSEITETQIILIYVGMALGALIGLVLIIVIIVVVIRRYRKRPKASEEENLQNQQSLTPTISNA